MHWFIFVFDFCLGRVAGAAALGGIEITSRPRAI